MQPDLNFSTSSPELFFPNQKVIYLPTRRTCMARFIGKIENMILIRNYRFKLKDIPYKVLNFIYLQT